MADPLLLHIGTAWGEQVSHERQETTAHYVSILHEDIRAMADQHHPRGANFERYVRW